MSQTTTGDMRLDTAALERARRRMLNPFAMRGYFLAKLPLALFAGLRIRELTREHCAVSVPYSWRTTNPFRSTYFAAQSMAAELSTGALALLAVESAPAPVAMLIVRLEAEFEKKGDCHGHVYLRRGGCAVRGSAGNPRDRRARGRHGADGRADDGRHGRIPLPLHLVVQKREASGTSAETANQGARAWSKKEATRSM